MPRQPLPEPERSERRRASKAAYRERNREALRAADREYRLAHPEVSLARQRAWAAANPERMRERRRLWRESHLEQERARNRERMRRAPYNPERAAYHAARQRTTNPRNSQWKHYGARGIEFRFESFEQFIDHIGPRPGPGYSLDRINVDGHYEPGNVRWATWVEQRANRRDSRRTGGAS